LQPLFTVVIFYNPKINDRITNTFSIVCRCNGGHYRPKLQKDAIPDIYSSISDEKSDFGLISIFTQMDHRSIIHSKQTLAGLYGYIRNPHQLDLPLVGGCRYVFSTPKGGLPDGVGLQVEWRRIRSVGDQGGEPPEMRVHCAHLPECPADETPRLGLVAPHPT